MEEKIRELEKCMADIGLTWDGVVSYLRQKKIESNSETLKSRELVNPSFPEEDIRSQTKLFWYAFEGKKFASNHDAYPNCQGVVGWINPDINALVGNRIYVVLPEQKYLPYSTRCCLTGADDLYDGRANTRKLLEYGKTHHVEFSAAEYAYNYTKNGVKQGEAFFPAKEQLKLVVKNCEGVRSALNLIGGVFDGCLWSSSEYFGNYAWGVGSGDGNMGYGNKLNTYSVSCFLAY